MAITIRPLDERSRAAWDRFVADTPSATFFHRAGWAEAVRTAFGHAPHYLFAEQDGAITGVLPLVQVKTRLFGDTLISNAFCVYGGVAAVDAESEAALLREAEALRARLGSTALELRDREPAAAQAEGWVERPDLYVTFRKPVDADNDKNMKAIPRKQRAMVRKAISSGLTSVVGSDAGALYPVYAESVRNLGTPVFSRRWFDVLMAVFGADADVVTILNQDKPVASVMNFYFRNEVLPYYGGGTSRGAGLRRQRLHVLGGNAPSRGSWISRIRFRAEQDRHRCVCVQAQLGLCRQPAALSVQAGPRRLDPRSQPDEPEIQDVHRRLEETAAAGGQRGRAVHRARGWDRVACS